MAIYRSQRKPTSVQYEDSFKKLYAEMRERMSHVPKRRRQSIVRPLMNAMNNVYDSILGIGEDPVKGSKTAEQARYRRILQAQDRFLLLEKPMFAWWSVCRDMPDERARYIPDHSRQYLCDRFNEVLAILHRMQTQSRCYDETQDRGVIQLMWFTQEQVKNARFLTVLQSLLRYTHASLIRLNAAYRDAEGEQARHLVNDAWYWALKGNFVPGNKEEAEERKKRFSRAIASLRKLERPLLAIMSTGLYTDEELTKWMDLLSQSLKLIQAVQRSDKERYAF